MCKDARAAVIVVFYHSISIKLQLSLDFQRNYDAVIELLVVGGESSDCVGINERVEHIALFLRRN